MTETTAMDISLKKILEEFVPGAEEHRELLSAVFSEDLSMIKKDISVPVKAGYGKWEGKTYPTLGQTLNGWAVLREPEIGTWTVRAYDSVRHEVIGLWHGVQADQRLEFGYKTNLACHPKVEAWWSEGGDTTAKVHVEIYL